MEKPNSEFVYETEDTPGKISVVVAVVDVEILDAPGGP
jgi:hypothetical protein